MEKKANNKKVIVGVIALAAMIILAAVCYKALKPEVGAGIKTVEIVVVSEDLSELHYTVMTDAGYLQQAMDQAAGLSYSGTESVHGIMIDTINGERASFDEDGAFWAFYVNGDYCNYGISQQPLSDGDIFKIEYTRGE